MKNLIRICLVLMFFCAFSLTSKAQNATSEEKRKLIAEIVVLTKAEKQFFEITDKMIQSFNTMLPAIVLQSLENNEKLKSYAQQQNDFLIRLMLRRKIITENDTIGNFPLDISGAAKMYLKQKPADIIENDSLSLEDFDF